MTNWFSKLVRKHERLGDHSHKQIKDDVEKVIDSSLDKELIDAVDGGDVARVQKLLENGAQVSADTLFFSIAGGNVDVVSLLLKAGANPDSINTHGYTALTYAINNRQPTIIGLLLHNGSKVDLPAKTHNMDEFTPLMIAAWEGLGDVAHELIRRGANVNATDGGGRTPMHFAAWHGHVELINILWIAGGDITVGTTDFPGYTPRFYAEHNGQSNAAHRLTQLEYETRPSK